MNTLCAHSSIRRAREEFTRSDSDYAMVRAYLLHKESVDGITALYESSPVSRYLGFFSAFLTEKNLKFRRRENELPSPKIAPTRPRLVAARMNDILPFLYFRNFAIEKVQAACPQLRELFIIILLFFPYP